MNEENKLPPKAGYRNPFKVPEGYFENLTENIMNNLPEQHIEKIKVTLWCKIKPWIYMAAMFCGIIFGAKLFIVKPTLPQEMGIETAFNGEQDVLPNMLIDPVSNQTMMDDYSLYKFLNEHEEELY